MYLPPRPKPKDPRDELVSNYKSNVIFTFFCILTLISGGFLFLFTFLANRYRDDETRTRKGKRVVIIGGGAAGSMVASALTTLDSDVYVTVIEKRRVQSFTSHIPLAAAGHRSYDLRVKGPSSLFASTTWTVTREAQLVIGEVTRIDPEKRVVVDEHGVQHPYDALIIATGCDQDHSIVGGDFKMDQDRVGVTPGGIRDFLYHSATGNVLIVKAPAKTPLHRQSEGTWISMVNTCWKHLHWHGRTGAKGLCEVYAITSDETVNDTLPQPHRDKVEELWAERGVTTKKQWSLMHVDRVNHVATFLDKATGNKHQLTFRLLAVDLAMTPSKLLQQIARGGVATKPNLVNADGFVPVDHKTLQHRNFEDVFALGDCTDLPVPKSYGAVSAQAPVIAHNVLQYLKHNHHNPTAMNESNANGSNNLVTDPATGKLMKRKPVKLNAEYDLYSSYHINMSTWRVMWPEMLGTDGKNRRQGFWWDDTNWETFGIVPGIFFQMFLYETMFWFVMLRAHWCAPHWFSMPLFPDAAVAEAEAEKKRQQAAPELK